jgi:serine protease inhibitor
VQKNIVVSSVVFLFCLLCSGCTTTRSVQTNQSIGTDSVSTAISDIGDKQTDSAVTAQAISDTAEAINDKNTELGESLRAAISELETGEGSKECVAEVIRRVSARPSIEYTEEKPVDKGAGKESQ